MVGIEVVADVTGFAGPAAEGVELGLRLAHVGVEVAEMAEGGDAIAGIGVDGVPALVHFHGAEDALFFGGADEFVMVGEGLDEGFGNEDVTAAVDRGEGDGVVGVIGGEDGDEIAGVKVIEGAEVGVRGGLRFIGREGGEAGVEAVAAADDGFQVGADAGEFGAVGAGHEELADETLLAEVEEGEADDASALVGAGSTAVNVAGGVFAGADHQGAWWTVHGRMKAAWRRAGEFSVGGLAAMTGIGRNYSGKWGLDKRAQRVLGSSAVMSQAVVDPEELRRFAAELKRFNEDLRERTTSLMSRYAALGDSWQDQEQEKFATEFMQTMKGLKRFNEVAERHAPYLMRKAEKIQQYLDQR